MAGAQILPRIALNISPQTNDDQSGRILQERWELLSTKYAASAPIRFSNVTHVYQSCEKIPTVAHCWLPDEARYDEWLLVVNMTGFVDDIAHRDMAKLDLTLLHEWIHLRFLNGHLKQQYRQAWQNTGQYCGEAMCLWNYVHEVAAEYYLMEAFPHLREQRARYLLEMVIAIRASAPPIPPGVTIWRAFYWLLRLDLAQRVMGRPMPEAASLRLESEQLIRASQGVLDLSDHLELRDRMLSLSLDPWKYDSGVFDEVRNRVQQVAPI